MAIDWVEIAIQVAFNGVILLGLLILGVRFLRKYVPMWAGGAIGRFWQTLTEKASEDEGSPGSGAPGSSPGTLNLGGFQIDVGSIRTIVAMLPEIANFLKSIQSFGFLTGAGGTSGGAPFKP